MKPARQLAYHLLDLPYHEQVKISHIFGFGTERHDISDLNDEKRCHAIVVQAYQDRKLDVLWTEVETRHREGKPTPNPFTDYKYLDKASRDS